MQVDNANHLSADVKMCFSSQLQQMDFGRSGNIMAFEDIKAEIALLFEQMVNQPEDAHEIEMVLREKLNILKAEGLPLPEDLVQLEKKLSTDFDP